MTRIWCTGFALLLATPAAAVASTPADEASLSDSGAAYPVFAAGEGGRLTARQWVPEAPSAAFAERSSEATSTLAQSRIIYLNRDGVALAPGSTNDSRTNKSTIAKKNVFIPAWDASDVLWSDTVECVREVFAPFAVKIVTEDPGDVPHLEAIFGGSASLLGLDANYGGISPFTSSCSTIENSIVFAFTDALSSNARAVCEVMAQEIAHSYGLDHELLASDPMTYLPYKGNRWFQDQSAACGEKEPRACGIGGSTCRATQNSAQLLRERLGVADPLSPSGVVRAPAEGDLLGADFDINVAAFDNVAVSSVEFFVDDVSIGSKLTAPYNLTAENIAPGAHTITAVVTDQARNTTRTQAVSVTVTAEADAGCSAAGSSSALPALGLLGLALARRRRRR